MEDNEYIELGNYAATRVQLRELFENIIARDIDFAADMLTLFANQKLERIREKRKTDDDTFAKQQEYEQKLERQVD